MQLNGHIVHAQNRRRAPLGHEVIGIVFLQYCHRGVVLDTQSKHLVGVEAVFVLHELSRVVTKIVKAGLDRFIIDQAWDFLIGVIINEIEGEVVRPGLVVHRQGAGHLEAAGHVIVRVPFFGLD